MKKEFTGTKNYALITGGSAGIGKAFAEELARMKVDLMLVALPGSGLEEFASYLTEKYSVTVKYLCVDLTTPEGPGKVKEFTNQNAIRIDILINNAGIGHIGALDEHTFEGIDEMILLNIRALTLMTRYYIEDLKKAEKGIVINLGSFGSFMPSPYKSIYIASKAYVYYFSYALRRELSGTNIRVLTLMPGPIMTNNTVIARINKAGIVGKATVLNPEDVVKEALLKINHRSGIILPGTGVKLTFYILGVLPFFIVNNFLKKVFRSNSR